MVLSILQIADTSHKQKSLFMLTLEYTLLKLIIISQENRFRIVLLAQFFVLDVSMQLSLPLPIPPKQFWNLPSIRITSANSETRNKNVTCVLYTFRYKPFVFALISWGKEVETDKILSISSISRLD